ncbi:hypothetical protein [uncultured Bartonella sp.]|uniref:hypothetical protein n=1 Tax=uncultured Bartonella sp. TaxID=104108 RepID=UPI0025E96EE9|nr:hypothetical protein [uncultured Bartonella sp.]
MHLVRLFFRMVSFLLLVVMIIALVIDAARSVGASTLVMTPIASTLSSVFGISPEKIATLISDSSPLYLIMFVKFANFCPTSLLCGVVSLIFYIVGYDRSTRFEHSTYGEGNG